MTVALALGVVALAAACGGSASVRPSTSTPPPAPPATAAPVDADPHVGAVFLGATDMHTCAAAVLHSKSGDLILTAAHCLAGGYNATFVPGFANTGGPAGTWRVNAVYLDPRWVTSQDPLADYAVARVARDRPGQGDPGTEPGSLEAAVGPGLNLGSAPQPGSPVSVIAYQLGVGGAPIGCTGSTGVTPGGFPSVKCAGFADGTSGAPWRSGSTVVGVIGGLHGGGCEENLSYSPPFDDALKKLLARAEAGGPPDSAPEVSESDCP